MRYRYLFSKYICDYWINPWQKEKSNTFPTMAFICSTKSPKAWRLLAKIMYYKKSILSIMEKYINELKEHYERTTKNTHFIYYF